MQKLTQKIVREYIRQLGGTFGDLQDALDTARAMKGGHPEIHDAEINLACEIGHA